MSLRLPIIVTLAVLFIAGAATAGESTEPPMTGTVSGRVLYEPDPARPWRFQRYYMKHPKSGELAEAVVALKGRELKHIRTARPPAAHVVDQFNYQFVPEITAIRAGETVTFTNSDATTHNVRSAASIAPFNITMEADDEFTYRFERAGGLPSPVLVGCVYHGGMRAWIYVFDHPYFWVTKSDGRFRFEEVPPGRYTLEVVHPAGGLRQKQTILVEPDEIEGVTVDLRLSPDHKSLR